MLRQTAAVVRLQAAFVLLIIIFLIGLPLQTAAMAVKYLPKNTKTSSYAVETSISPQFSNIPGYTTKMYYWDERYNSSNIQTVSRDKLLSMWSDVLN